MLARFQAQCRELRLELQISRLRRRERLALRRLGEAVAKAGASESTMAPILVEIAEGERRVAGLLAESHLSLEADRADMRAVAGWVKPVVIIRGLCTRLVLRHRRSGESRALRPRLEVLGDLASRSSVSAAAHPSPLRDVIDRRDQVAALVRERDRWGAPYGGRALPAWTGRAAGEATMFGRAVAMQLRSHILPKAPAIAGLCVGWWIANTYTDSHLRSVFRSIGLGSGGTRVVSSSTYEAMTFWLPLLAAALCAYLGERIGAYYRGHGSVEDPPRTFN